MEPVFATIFAAGMRLLIETVSLLIRSLSNLDSTTCKPTIWIR